MPRYLPQLQPALWGKVKDDNELLDLERCAGALKRERPAEDKVGADLFSPSRLV